MKKYFLSITLFACALIGQQNNGIVAGTVIDAVSKDGLPFATVVLLGTGIGTAADIDGNFEIRSIPPGTYQLRASLVGYSPIVKTDITVTNSKPVQVDFSLNEEVLQLSGVTVTTDFFDKSLNQFNSVNSFSYEEIRRAPGGFEDVIRALAVLPGVAQADAGRNDLIVRGGAPSENLYLVDGIEVPNINHFGTQGATGGPLSYINLDFVKETSFSTGGFPVMFGNRLSSVLEINLREGRSDKIGGKGTISGSQFGLNLEGPVSTNSRFIFSARRSYLDFIFKAAGFGFVPEYYDFLTKYDYDIDKHNTITFLNITAIDNIRYFNNSTDQRLSNSRVLGSEQFQYFSGLVYKHIMPTALLNVIVSRNFVDYNTVQKDTLLNPIFLNDSRESENKIKIDFTTKLWQYAELQVGSEGKFVRFFSDVKIPFFTTSFGELLPITAQTVKNNFLKYALYSNLSSRFLEKWTFSGGIRLDYFDGLDSRFAVSPRGSIAYRANDKMNLSLGIGRYTQYPSYIWLAAGNTNLAPIALNQYILGGDYSLRDDALLKAELFFKDYFNYPASLLRPYITLANTGGGFGGADDNFSSFGLEPLTSAGKGSSHGVELSAQKKLSDTPFYGIASLTYSRTLFSALDGIARAGTYDQRWIFNLSGGYKFSESLELSMKFRYASGRPYTPFRADGSQTVENYNSERLPSLHSLDIRVDKHWFFEHITLITYVDVQNLYNRRNISQYRWDPRKRSVEANSSIGILPSLGLSLEF
jgi:hypothetical protein